MALAKLPVRIVRIGSAECKLAQGQAKSMNDPTKLSKSDEMAQAASLAVDNANAFESATTASA